MELAWVALLSRSSWVVEPVLALVTVRASSLMRRSERTERPPSWAPREVDSRSKPVRRRSMESLEASSWVVAMSPEGSSAARLMRFPVERRSRDWAMSARF